MTITIGCGTSKGCIYKQIKAPLVGEHAYPPTGFVCWSAHVTNFGGSGGIMTTARPELPYPCTFMLFPGQVYGQGFSVRYERTSKHAFS